jgi:hypothetical protein
MKYVKVLGLLAVAAAAMMAFAATASATTLTSPTGTVYTGAIHATSEGHAILQNPIAKIECASTVEGSIEQHGAGKTVKGNISNLSFTGCTNDWHVTVVTAGSLELHYKAAGEGTVTSSGATVEATRFGVNCRYKTENTDVGTFTDSHKTAHEPGKDTTATMDIHGLIPFHSGSFLCGSGATTWEGSYIVNTPDRLYIDQE